MQDCPSQRFLSSYLWSGLLQQAALHPSHPHKAAHTPAPLQRTQIVKPELLISCIVITRHGEVYEDNSLLQECSDGCLFPAAVGAVFFNGLLSILLTSAQMHILQGYSSVDPLLLAPPSAPTASSTPQSSGALAGATDIYISLVSPVWYLCKMWGSSSFP